MKQRGQQKLSWVLTPTHVPAASGQAESTEMKTQSSAKLRLLKLPQKENSRSSHTIIMIQSIKLHGRTISMDATAVKTTSVTVSLVSFCDSVGVF